MARSNIDGYQTSPGTVIPELDWSDPDIQAVADSYAGTGFTNECITWAQFVDETGYTGPNPMANLGQTHVLKSTFNGFTSSGVNFVAEETLATPIDITRGFAGMFVFLTQANKDAMGIAGVRAFFSDGSIGGGNYNLYDMPVYSDNITGTWAVCGGLDETGYRSTQAGSPDTTAIDTIRLNMDGDSQEVTLYTMAPFYGARRRPMIMWQMDDINDSAADFATDADTYGIKMAYNGIFARVIPSILSEAALKTIIDNGHTVHLHAQNGLVTGHSSDVDAYIAEIEADLASWQSFYPSKLTNETLKHFAIPLGEMNAEARARMRALGFLTMTNVGTVNEDAIMGQAGYGCMPDYLSVPRWTMDGKTTADFTAHVDICIKHGMDSVIYLHDYVTAGIQSEVQGAMAYHQEMVQKGLIDQGQIHKWYPRSISQYGYRDNV